MSDTTFSAGTVIASTWLNAVNDTVYNFVSTLGGTARTITAKANDIVDARDFGIVVDGTTDQTTALNTITSALGTAGFRGDLHIPANTKFTATSVFAALPLGVGLNIIDTTNWGQPPSYKNKFHIKIRGDSVSDDSQEIVASNHHPAIMLLNMGTSGSLLGTYRGGSILHGVGQDQDKDPMLGWLQQFAKDPSTNAWRFSLRLQTPYEIAIANPLNWTTATVYAAGAYCRSDGGKVYKTPAGGTSGATAPTGTGTVSDGAVSWVYTQAALNIDSTRFDILESGSAGFYGPGTIRTTFQGGSKSHYFEIDSSTGIITWRDAARGLNVLSVSDEAGIQFGVAIGHNWLATSGTGPNAPSTGYGKIANAGATTMTTMVPPAGKTSMMVVLRFDNANTTVAHGTGTNAFVLKGAVNIATAPSGGYLTLFYDSTDSGAWREYSRSF